MCYEITRSDRKNRSKSDAVKRINTYFFLKIYIPSNDTQNHSKDAKRRPNFPKLLERTVKISLKILKK